MYYIQKKQMWIFDDNDKQAARNVSVVDFLTRHYGFSFKRIGHGFRCREHDSLFVKADERTWYWNSQRIGGGDVLEFVMKYENKTYAEALEVVLNPTQSQSDRPQFKNAPPTDSKSEKQELILPPRAKGQFKRAYAYLTISRCIAPDIVTTLMHKQYIYEDIRGNCVFVGRNKKGKFVYAQIRSTNTNSTFRIDAEGSDKENSFYLRGFNERKVYVFESPIDLLSHATLTDMRCGKGKWVNDTRLSLGGNSDVALAHFVKEYSKVEEICFCVDNDKGGEKAIEAYAQKYESMGYKVTREIPKLKDFNEDLVNLIRPHPNILRR